MPNELDVFVATKYYFIRYTVYMHFITRTSLFYRMHFYILSIDLTSVVFIVQYEGISATNQNICKGSVVPKKEN